MQKCTRWIALSLILPLGMLVACGGDGGDGGGGNGTGTGPDTPDGLTEQEAQEMVEALASTGVFSPTLAGNTGMGMGTAGASGTVPVEFEVSDTESCPGGGSVLLEGTLSGDVDQETGAGEFQLTVDQTHQDCVASSESDRSFTFDGAPSVNTDMDFMISADGSYDVTGTNTGGFDWQSEGESGSCDIDLSYEFSGSSENFSGSVEGSICGVDVSHSVEAEVGG